MILPKKLMDLEVPTVFQKKLCDGQHYNTKTNTTFTFWCSRTFLVHHVSELPEIQFVIACEKDIWSTV